MTARPVVCGMCVHRSPTITIVGAERNIGQAPGKAVGWRKFAVGEKKEPCSSPHWYKPRAFAYCGKASLPDHLRASQQSSEKDALTRSGSRKNNNFRLFACQDLRSNTSW